MRRVLLGDNPIRAGVGEAQPDEPAQVERGGSVMQPVIVLGDAAVAQFAVAAGQPGDGAFDHRPVLAVFGQPIRVTGGLSGGALPRVMGADFEFLALAAARCIGPAVGNRRRPRRRLACPAAG